MESWIQIAGTACTLYFLAELWKLGRQTCASRRFMASDPRTGRRLNLRPDRRNGERRGARRS